MVPKKSGPLGSMNGRIWMVNDQVSDYCCWQIMLEEFSMMDYILHRLKTNEGPDDVLEMNNEQLMVLTFQQMRAQMVL